MDLGLRYILVPALQWFASWVGNYGVAVILATIIMRVLLLPLDVRQRKMALRTREIQPQLDKLKQQYANNPQQLNKATQELQKKHGISMAAGCLPALIQLPVMMGFFTALRQLAATQVQAMYDLAAANNIAGFADLMNRSRFLWIGNVFQPDAVMKLNLGMLFGNSSGIQAVRMIPDAEAIKAISGLEELANYDAIMAPFMASYGSRVNGFFIVALLAGVFSFLQNKLSSVNQPQAQPGQPNTGKMMSWMMLAMAIIFCLTQSAAFGLYWITSSIMAIALQLAMNYFYDPERKAQKAAEQGPLDAFPDRKKKREAK
ncbi:MAG: YidC/Oxa1 family membrane protein insertase [Christensenellales bacterium]|jgi:YidC/Oxa1 family membrane protein insertase